MRILALNPSPMLGGAEFSLLDVLVGLMARGHSVCLCAPCGGPLLEEAQARRIPVREWAMPRMLRRVGRYSGVIQVALSPFAAVGAIASLASLVRAVRPDVVYSNGIKSHLLAAAVRPFGAPPVVWHVRDFVGGRGISSLLFAVARLTASGVIANSRAVAEEWWACGINATVVHNGFRSTDCAQHERVVGNSLKLLAVGILAPWKGFEQILRACAGLPGSLNWTLTVCGDEIYETDGHRGERARLERLACTLGISNRVSLTGMVRDLSPFWKEADVLIHASIRPEPFGRVVAEAMAAGIPPIAVDAGGVSEIVRDGIDGLLYPMGNVEALRRAILKLADAPDKRSQMGVAARERIANQFSIEKKVVEIESVLCAQAVRSPGLANA
jgi:glycosyltransferase involved in cell wall biosynthesis